MNYHWRLSLTILATFSSYEKARVALNKLREDLVSFVHMTVDSHPVIVPVTKISIISDHYLNHVREYSLMKNQHSKNNNFWLMDRFCELCGTYGDVHCESNKCKDCHVTPEQDKILDNLPARQAEINKIVAEEQDAPTCYHCDKVLDSGDSEASDVMGAFICVGCWKAYPSFREQL